MSSATEGSAAVDVCTTQDILLLPGETPLRVPTGIFGPIPPNTVGLLLGRSNLTSKGVTVHTGIIDSDYEGEIQIIISSTVPWSAKKGERIAQLLLLPYVPPKNKGINKRGTGGFGSTGEAGIFLVEKISDIRPTCQIELQGKKFKGLIDTGADVSIISSQQWPKNWELQDPDSNIIGVGRASGLRQNVQILPCAGPEDQKGFLQPYVADIPINLWERDLLTQWSAEVWIPPNQYSPQSHTIMSRMGFQPGQGLGKFKQGITQPLQPPSQQGRQGLGYQPKQNTPFL